MNWNEWIRQAHRWTSIAFTVAVIVNIVAMTRKEPAVWVGLLALFPLVLLLISGLYLFVLPDAATLERLHHIRDVVANSAASMPFQRDYLSAQGMTGSAPLHAPTVGAESYALASRFGPPVACFQRFSLEFPTVWKIGTTLE